MICCNPWGVLIETCWKQRLVVVLFQIAKAVFCCSILNSLIQRCVWKPSGHLFCVFFHRLVFSCCTKIWDLTGLGMGRSWFSAGCLSPVWGSAQGWSGGGRTLCEQPCFSGYLPFQYGHLWSCSVASTLIFQIPFCILFPPKLWPCFLSFSLCLWIWTVCPHKPMWFSDV